jgi:hypothetical protein
MDEENHVLWLQKERKGLSMEPGGAPSLTGSHLENYCLSLLSIITLWNFFKNKIPTIY